MSEVKRFRADHRHVVETEFDDAQFVGVADFDRVTAERDAERRRADVAVADANAADAAGNKVSELLSNRTAERDALQALLTAADDRADVLGRDKARIDWLAEQPVDTLYLDDGRIIDIAGRADLRDAIDAAMAAPRPTEGGGDEA